MFNPFVCFQEGFDEIISWVKRIVTGNNSIVSKTGVYKVPYSPPPGGGGKFIKRFGEEYQIDRREGKREKEKGKGKGKRGREGKRERGK